MHKINVEGERDKLFALTLDYKCPYKWSQMKGDSLVRHCGSCKQNVYNVSNMTRDEAVDLISKNEGEVCVRFYQRRDGTVVTKECFSVFGTGGARPKLPVLAYANLTISAVVLSIVPMLGPAMVTIVQGVGPAMASPTDARESLQVKAAPKAEPRQANFSKIAAQKLVLIQDCLFKIFHGRQTP